MGDADLLGCFIGNFSVCSSMVSGIASFIILGDSFCISGDWMDDLRELDWIEDLRDCAWGTHELLLGIFHISSSDWLILLTFINLSLGFTIGFSIVGFSTKTGFSI
eukprot:NODE_143_length_15882_cov_1.296585.p13 type:complete len:106 gc:universal NODE_143_length_15882_cov_1.296585:3419-3736(+)